MAETSRMDRNLALEAVRVTELAALSASRLMGRGDEKAADQAAVDAMRQALNSLSIEGTVVIGEGERDEAPMLFIGEKVGTGQGPKIDIALDPLEGTTITAKGGANALAVLAMADDGGFLNAPDVYMDKIAVGGGLPDGVVDLDESRPTNLKNLAQAKKLEIADLVVCILDRPRHAELIAKVREAGARIMLIGDGDVCGVMATSDPETGIDIYMGSGGAPEGVLAAAALRCIGGQMQGRLLFRNDDERGRAHRLGINDLNRKYSLLDMAHGDVMFAATGVTNGSMLRGVRRFRRRRLHAFGRDALEDRHRSLRRGQARLHPQAAALRPARAVRRRAALFLSYEERKRRCLCGLLRGFLGAALDHLLGGAAGQLRHVVELAGEAADPEGQRAQFDDQVVQFAARQVRPDDVPARPVLLGVVAEDLAAPAGNQPLHPGGEDVRHRDLDRVDRLQAGSARISAALPGSPAARRS